MRQEVAIVDGAAELRLPSLGDYEAYVVLIRDSEGIPQKEGPAR